MSETIKEMIPEEKIVARIAQMGAQISKEYEGESVFIVCILRGAAQFACELAKRITVPVTIDYMTTSSYGSGTVSSGNIQIKNDIGLSVEGQNVLIVEDIIDSGHTLEYLLEVFKNRGAKSVRLATLLDKPSRREVEVPVDYCGFQIPDEFVVGYGLDYDQKYRNLPYIAAVEL